MRKILILTTVIIVIQQEKVPFQIKQNITGKLKKMICWVLSHFVEIKIPFSSSFINFQSGMSSVKNIIRQIFSSFHCVAAGKNLNPPTWNLQILHKPLRKKLIVTNTLVKTIHVQKQNTEQAYPYIIHPVLKHYIQLIIN